VRAEPAVRRTWYLYLVRTASGALYTGISTDPERRLREHEQGMRGARSLRGRGPLVLVYRQAVGDRSTALKAEHAVKRLPRARKERLVAGERSLGDLVRDVAVPVMGSVEA
jgi:putative endonuclease